MIRADYNEVMTKERFEREFEAWDGPGLYRNDKSYALVVPINRQPEQWWYHDTLDGEEFQVTVFHTSPVPRMINALANIPTRGRIPRRLLMCNHIADPHPAYRAGRGKE